MIKVLFVEDDVQLNFAVSSFLKIRDYEIIGITDGNLTMKAFEEMNPDVVLIDIHLPGSPDGFMLAHEIKKLRNVPLLFATGKTEESVLRMVYTFDKVDYLPKPYRLEELNFRIQNLIAKGINPLVEERVFSIGDFLFYPEENKISIQKKTIRLQQKECEVLLLLYENRSKIVYKEKLLDQIWDDLRYRQRESSLYNSISHLRKYLKADKKISIECISKKGWILYIKTSTL